MPRKTLLSNNSFVHLHNHTEYSLLDGLTKIGPLMEFIVEQKMRAVAITDHGTLSGAIEFYKEAKSRDIKPIIGIEAYVATRTHLDKDPTLDKNRYHLILLASSKTGYQNLMRLSSIANLDGFYYYPRIDHDLIEKYSEGIICLSGCMGSEIGEALSQDRFDDAKKIASWYKSIFGDRYYLEVQDHGHPKNPKFSAEQEKVNELLFKLGEELGIQIVVTSDAHYLHPEDQEAHEVLLCVGTGSFFQEKNRMSLVDFPLHVTPAEEIIGRWGSDHPEVIENTSTIADRCDLEIEFDQILIPEFKTPKGVTDKDFLENLVYQGLAWRYSNKTPSKAKKLSIPEAKKMLPEVVLQRADYELSVIEQMGFNSYFLIISDFVNWGKDRGIVFGPGRGSAAGSIVSYALRITELDPLKYDLIFERFLNPDRISMPDIDIDIQDNRREEVINYCVEKYGRDRTANIVTFGRMFARNAVRDVARVLEVPYKQADTLAKLLPLPVQGRHIPLADTIKTDATLKEEYSSNEVSHKVLDLAIKLEGTVRSHGVHAAGIVIAPSDIINFVPLERAQKGVLATQYSLGPIEQLGLVKMDLLGLSNLTIIKNALRIIKKVYGVSIDIDQIPLDDTKTFELFKAGDTTGIFQFESSGMKRYLKELKPTVFEDIIAMGGLYRPGPLTAGLTQKFMDRKNGKEPIIYDHEKMKNALSTTYGVMVYQEQVMQIARDMCGFTVGEADSLRKAVGKKIRSMMAKMKDKIIEGAIKNGVEKKTAEKFWTDLEGFADYAFPKAHAACYGLISYQTAYLKAHYPAAFMAALMTSDFDNTDRLTIEISECQRMGIAVLPPDINESFVEFAVVKDTNQIRFGLAAIKNVGTAAVEEILEARSAGEFKSLEEFFQKVSHRSVNRKTLESLIKAGAFDKFGGRLSLLQHLDALLGYSSRLNKDRLSGQTDLFGDQTDLIDSPIVKLKLSDDEDSDSMRVKLGWERELLGIYLSEHPLSAFELMLSETTVPISEITESSHNKEVQVGGSIIAVRQIATKSNQRMGFVTIEDRSGNIELILFPKVYEKAIEVLERDRVVRASGKITSRGKDGSSSDTKVLVEKINELSLDEARNYKPGQTRPVLIEDETGGVSSTGSKRLFIRLDNSEDQELLLNLRQTIDQNTGETDVILVLGGDNADKKQIIKLPTRITPNDSSMAELTALVGADNLKFN
ncbi:MAG TPA: DNA polymerase III subunit alpha [Candidatus Saccharimonadales bacterium]|nr:DNA polymerase III subunit alpha [Candidatus Saccharimonadales bacterium]